MARVLKSKIGKSIEWEFIEEEDESYPFFELPVVNIEAAERFAPREFEITGRGRIRALRPPREETQEEITAAELAQARLENFVIATQTAAAERRATEMGVFDRALREHVARVGDIYRTRRDPIVETLERVFPARRQVGQFLSPLERAVGAVRRVFVGTFTRPDGTRENIFEEEPVEY